MKDYKLGCLSLGLAVIIGWLASGSSQYLLLVFTFLGLLALVLTMADWLALAVLVQTSLPPAVGWTTGFLLFPVGGLQVYLGEMISWGLVALWLAYLGLGKARLKKSNLSFPLLVLYGWFGTALLIGLGNGHGLSLTLLDFRELLPVFPVYFLALSVINGEKEIRKIVFFFLGGLALHFAWLAFLYANSIGLTSSRLGSQGGILVLPGLTLALALIFLVHEKKAKGAGLAIFPLLWLITFLSRSRVLWVAIILNMPVLAALLFKYCLGGRRIFRATGNLILLAAVSLFLLVWLPGQVNINSATLLDSVLDRVESLSHLERDDSMVLRKLDMISALDLIREKPFAGHGFGALIFLNTWRSKGPYIDNVWLTLAVKAGTIGLILFLAVLGKYLSNLHQVFKDPGKMPGPYTRAFVLAQGAALPGLALCSFFTAFLVKWPVVMFVLAIFAAAIEVCGRKSEEETP